MVKLKVNVVRLLKNLNARQCKMAILIAEKGWICSGITGLQVISGSEDWLRFYLADLDSFVLISNNKAERTKITCGVLLGSILGPNLFNIY